MSDEEKEVYKEQATAHNILAAEIKKAQAPPPPEAGFKEM